jgi:DNA mismatch endonuclease (patch repair protein)
VNSARLPGKPDIVFRKARVVVFCDGDFWHGRRLRNRVQKLSSGHNAPYWVAKIQKNVARNRRTNRALRADRWTVIRLWETDIMARADVLVAKVEETLSAAGRSND